MNKLSFSLLLFSGFLWWCARLAGTNVVCNDGTYWDTGTEHCMPCTDLCAIRMGPTTIEECKTKCSGWLGRRIGVAGDVEIKPTIQTIAMPSNDCWTGSYYDEGTENCMPCGSLCSRGRGNSVHNECLAKCPGFVSPDPGYLTAVPNITMSSSACLKGSYYDNGTENCMPCTSLCSPGRGDDSHNKCLTQCPDFMLTTPNPLPGGVDLWIYIVISLVITLAIFAVIVLAICQRLGFVDLRLIRWANKKKKAVKDENIPAENEDLIKQSGPGILLRPDTLCDGGLEHNLRPLHSIDISTENTDTTPEVSEATSSGYESSPPPPECSGMFRNVPGCSGSPGAAQVVLRDGTIDVCEKCNAYNNEDHRHSVPYTAKVQEM